MREFSESRPSELVEEFVRIAERADRQRKEFDEAMKPILEELHRLAKPAVRAERRSGRMRRRRRVG